MFDLLADLASRQVNPRAAHAWDLAGRLVDECVALAARQENAARERYQREAARAHVSLPEELDLARPVQPLLPGWLAIDLDLTLARPWYSKDDRPFHVLHNPVRKDRVFGVPFMAPASWKGLFRWACRMEAGFLRHLERHDGRIAGWKDPDWIVHLFGNARGEDEHFSRGAMQWFPTWFDQVGFEVLNPHDRARRAGTKPILYEVVPAGTKGTLRLLYAPPPGLPGPDDVAPADALRNLVEAAEKLLTVYGFSAKRTAGWGIADVAGWEARTRSTCQQGSKLAALKEKLPRLLGSGGGVE